MKTKIILIGLLFFLSCSNAKKLERKADKGDMQSCYALVELYSGCDYYTSDKNIQKKLVKYCKKGLSIAIDTNVYDQASFYGKFYGELAKSNLTDKADKHSYYQKAAKFGDAESQWTMGLYYLEGKGGQIQKDSAMYWIKKAAGGNSYSTSVMATKKMGDIYYEGKLVTQDSLIAIYYYKKACACYGTHSDYAACKTVVTFYKNQKDLKDTTELAIYSELARQLSEGKMGR